MCIDYLAINHITTMNGYPLPHIEDLVRPLGGTSFFLKIDCAWGCHKIRIRMGDQQKLAFSTTHSHYEWTDLTCHQANTLSQYILVMNHLLASNPKLRTLLAVCRNDVLIHRLTRWEHMDHVQAVCHHSRTTGLKPIQWKWVRFRNEIEFCGLQIDEEGCHTLGTMMEAVAQCPRPRNVRLVWGFSE